MNAENIVYPERLQVDRVRTTWIARRAIAYWSGRGWLDFSGSSRLANVSPNVAALRNLLARCAAAQQGFETFNERKFEAAWQAHVERGPGTVLSVYDAFWGGFS